MWTLGKSKPDNAGIFRGTQGIWMQVKTNSRGHEEGRLERWVAEDHRGEGRPDKTIWLLKQWRHWIFWAKKCDLEYTFQQQYTLKLFSGSASYRYMRI